MPRSNPVRQATFEEYLKLEETSEMRHEFVDGYVFAMAGEKKRHNRIAGAVYDRVLALVENTPCRVYINGIKVRTPNEVGYYPDVFAVCDDDGESEYYTRKPCFIVEVLSDSTEATDRGEKLHNYTLIPTLQTYVLLSQDEAKAEVYSRLEDGTWRYEVIREDGRLRLPCVGLDVGLEEIYAGV